MKHLLIAIGLASAAIVTAPPQETNTLVLSPAGCESLAPLRIEILSSEVSFGVADIKYRVTPLMDVLKVESAFELPGGAELLSHRQAWGEGVATGSGLDGRASVRLPEGATRITLRSTITFEATSMAANDNDSQVEILDHASVLRDLTWGDFQDTVDLPLVQSGAEMTLDTPAIRTGGDL